MNKKKLVLLICFVIWGFGVLFFYNQFENRPYREYKIIDGAIAVDPVTGEFLYKNFFEAKRNHLFLLTVVCGIPALIVLIKKG